MITDIVIALAWPPAAALLVRPALARLHRLWREPHYSVYWVSTAAGCVIADLQDKTWPAAAIAAVQVAIGLWLWRRGKHRKRRLRATGARARARIAAMVATLRERAQPRPVLRPAPGGMPA